VKYITALLALLLVVGVAPFVAAEDYTLNTDNESETSVLIPFNISLGNIFPLDNPIYFDVPRRINVTSATFDIYMEPNFNFSHDWTTGDTIIESGLATLNPLGTASAPEVFVINNVYYMIVTIQSATYTYFGFAWNGSGWDDNVTATSGLVNFTNQVINPAHFQNNLDHNLILGFDNGTFLGYTWNGSGWELNDSINNGLWDVSDYATPTVFEYGGETHLVTGLNNGTFIGFTWNGTGWGDNSSIVNGLQDAGTRSAPDILNIYGELQFISGNSAGSYHSYYWDNTTWIVDSSTVNGLGGDVHGTPDMFFLNSTIYLLIGRQDAYTYGFNKTTTINFTVDTIFDFVTDYEVLINANETIVGADINITAFNSYIENNCTSDWSTGICTIPVNISLNVLSDDDNSTGAIEIQSMTVSGVYYNPVGECGTVQYVPALYFWFSDEVNLINMNGSSNYLIEDISLGVSYNGSVNNVDNFTICTFNDSTYTVNMTVLYWNETSDQRSYYFYHADVDSDTAQNITLYHIPSAESEKVEITVLDSNDNIVEDAYVSIQRYYVDENDYRVVTIGKTDTEGKFIAYLYTDTVFYRFIVSQGGEVRKIYTPMVITDTTDDPETLTLYTTPSETQFFEIRESVTSSCYSNTSSNYTICVVSDTSGLITSARLYVEHYELTGPYTICEESGSGSSFTLSCFLGNDANGTYRWFLELTPDPNPPYVFSTGQAYYPEVTVFGDYGLMSGLMILLTTAAISLINPGIAAILAVLGLATGMALEMVEVSAGSLIGLFVISVIIFFQGRRIR